MLNTPMKTSGMLGSGTSRPPSKSSPRSVKP